MTNPVREPSARPRPRVDRENEHFWTGGSDGRLHILRCQSCRFFIHPPLPTCPRCESLDVVPEPVSGRGVIDSYTINWHQWHPAMPPPYVIALVALDEQPSVRLTTNLVRCDVEAAQIGLRVHVVFEERDGIWYPLFTPDTPAPEVV
jgi:uncharacterized OB-fold protein